MPVSIKDVAERAGVSRGTVSSVMNADMTARISARTREHVQRIAEELGYAPNRLARSLGRRRTDTIGLLIAGLRNPFFVELMESAERLAQSAGFDVLTDDTFLTRPAARPQGKLFGWPVDGVLMWSTGVQTLSEHLGPQSVGTPIVYLGYERSDGAAFVALDHYRGARAAIEHLAARGYRRIGYLTPVRDAETGQGAEARVAAYEDICREWGLTPEYPLVAQRGLYAPSRQTGWREIGYASGLELAAAKDRSRAVFCHNDAMAIGVYHGVRRGGLRVPEDMAVVGFDGISEGLCLDKTLTSVTMPIEALCQSALELLLSQMRGDQDSGLRSVLLEPALRVGETS